MIFVAHSLPKRHHSDRGSQHMSPPLSRAMREHGVRPSMGSISSPWDNAAMESLMDIVKPGCLLARLRRARGGRLDLLEYIEVVYSRTVIHSAPGHLGPAELEKASWPAEDSRSKAA